MPWNALYYPRAMEHLEPATRAKAIEIANALLRDGHDEGFAIRVAISQAERWSLRQSSVGRLRHD